MSVTIWDGYYFDYDVGYLPYGYTYDLSNYTQADGQSWNNDVSSLYTTDYLYVFDYTGYDRSGTYALLSPGYWSASDLEYLGLNNDISSFYTTSFVYV